MLTSVLFFSEAIRREAELVLAEAPEMIVQRTVAGRHELIPLHYVQKIQGIRGVHKVEPRLWGYYYHQASKANYTVMASAEFALQDDQIIIGEGVPRTWQGVQEGRLFFRAHDGAAVPLTIHDSLSAESALVSADLILMTEPTFRRIFGVAEGFATDLAASIRNPKEFTTIAEKVTQLLPDTRPVLREEILRTYASLFDWRSGYVVVLLSGAVLAFFIFAWDKATGLTAEERIGNRYSQGHRMGHRRCAVVKVLGRHGHLPERLCSGCGSRIRACVSGPCTPVRACLEGLGGAVPFLRADAGI